ncbi:hypothetical protein QTG54_005226 [Skeletonema marinoi]|uniref:GH26 domain-containing protein n=1 Tax=Skeletonema marinoi TaxID=267567 RepID=A0AAD8YDK1_9STRA|nr:hypothetical protein QTG54_005226 [Skeletonema marinoi]
MSSEAACRPPAGSTYLCVGQDLFSVNEYVMSQYNYSLHVDINSTADAELIFVPSSFMVYTDLQTLRGLWAATDYGSGIQYADGLLDLFPSIDHSQAAAGLQIGLWLNGTQGCYSICEGELDNQIEQLIAYLEHSRASKILLRLGYEFDNPSFGYSDHPELYILAFRKIVTDCRRLLSRRCICRLDWCQYLQQVLPWSPPWGGQVSDVENVLKFAQEHDKPTMIAESTPFGGIELKQARKRQRRAWMQLLILGTVGMASHCIIDKYDVSMWCYINCDWESQPQWHNVGFGETRLASNMNIKQFDTDSDKYWFTPDHFLSFILVPFIVASAAFFLPYYMLGGIRGRDKSTTRERRPLLADI